MIDAIIYGAGTYGQVYASYISEDDNYRVIGFIDDASEKIGTNINNLPVLGNREYLFSLGSKENIAIFVPIGNNTIREKLILDLVNAGFSCPSFVHKETIIHSTVNIGNFTYVLPGTNIMPLTRINDFTMISMGVNIAHHTIIDRGVFISQGVNVGASINIGEKAFIGIGSTIMTGIRRIGGNTIVGAGAVVIKDIPDNAVVVGNPGRIIKYKKD